MKLTKLIEATTNGLDRLEKRRDAQAALVKVEGQKLTAMREEYDAQRAMLNSMLKLQDLMPKDETLEFKE